MVRLTAQPDTPTMIAMRASPIPHRLVNNRNFRHDSNNSTDYHATIAASIYSPVRYSPVQCQASLEMSLSGVGVLSLFLGLFVFAFFVGIDRSGAL